MTRRTLERPDHTKLELTVAMRINQGSLHSGGPVPSHRLHVTQDVLGVGSALTQMLGKKDEWSIRRHLRNHKDEDR
jgi:hypothetical protein